MTTKNSSNDLEATNPRKQIQQDYSNWVDDICEVCDWKTNITMDEVQAVYSRLAIELAIKELSSLTPASSIKERIQYLQSLIDD
jgi:hypothetical protein